MKSSDWGGGNVFIILKFLKHSNDQNEVCLRAHNYHKNLTHTYLGYTVQCFLKDTPVKKSAQVSKMYMLVLTTFQRAPSTVLTP